MHPDFVRVTEAAEQLGVSPQALRSWARRGLIRVIRTAGGHYRVPRAEVTRLKLGMLSPVGGAR